MILRGYVRRWIAGSSRRCCGVRACGAVLRTRTGQGWSGLVRPCLIQRRQQPIGLCPCLLRCVAGDHVQADAVVHCASVGLGEVSDPRQLGGNRGGRFAPRQIGISVACGDGARCGGGATEEDLRHRVGFAPDAGILRPKGGCRRTSPVFHLATADEGSPGTRHSAHSVAACPGSRRSRHGG